MLAYFSRPFSKQSTIDFVIIYLNYENSKNLKAALAAGLVSLRT